MEFKIVVKQSEYASPEEFSKALACAAQSVESVMYDTGVTVKLAPSEIVVAPTDNSKLQELSLEEFRERVTGSFADGGLRLYPEFKSLDIHVHASA